MFRFCKFLAFNAIFVLFCGGAYALTIDTYDFNSSVNTVGGSTSTTDNDASSIFGTEREITITDNGGANSTFSVNPGGAFAGNSAFISGVGANATVEILYDGVGSGGFAATDFTEGGTHDRFLFNIRLQDFASRLDIEVTSAGGGVSESLNNILPSAGFGNTAFAVLFGSFSQKAGALSAADFSAITSLKMSFITIVPATDLFIDFVTTSDTTTIPPLPPAPPPPPGGGIVLSEPQSLAVFGLALIAMARVRRQLRKA